MKCFDCGNELIMGQLFCTHCKKQIVDLSSYNLLLTEANKGNADAQALVGKVYMNGLCSFQIDYKKARIWFEKSSMQNNATGLYGMGAVSLYDCDEDSLDEKIILQYTERSVQLGSTDGMLLLSDLYLEEIGVMRNEEEAFRWIRLAADKGNPDAMYLIGEMYEKGHHVSKDDAESIRWYCKAKESGSARALYKIGLRYTYGFCIAQNTERANELFDELMGRDDSCSDDLYAIGNIYCANELFPQNEIKAFRFFYRAAGNDHIESMFKLAKLYEEGRGCEQDYKQARYWYDRAAQNNHCESIIKLGAMYRDGRGAPDVGTDSYSIYKYAALLNNNTQIPQNELNALEFYRLAAEKGELNAMVEIGRIYSSGKLVPQNDNEAYQWFLLASEAGSSLGLSCLINSIEEKKGVTNNEERAFLCVKKAAEKSNINAIRMLGLMYLYGRGVEKNECEAFRLIKFAADKGNHEAMLNLALMYENGISVPKDLNIAKEILIKLSSRNLSYMYNAGWFFLRQRDYESAFSYWKKYFEYAEPDMKPASDVIWHNLLNIYFNNMIYPQFKLSGEKYFYRSTCVSIYNYREENRFYDGTSYFCRYGQNGTGFFVLTDLSIYLYSFSELTQKTSGIRKQSLFENVMSHSNTSFASISKDCFVKIPYQNIRNYYLDPTGNLIIDSTTRTLIVNNSAQEIECIVAAIDVSRHKVSCADHLEGLNVACIEKINNLKFMRDSGVITKEMYEDSNKKILEEMGI